MADIVMPRLSDSMEEGTILKWLKRSGDEVALGEELAEIETDKATMTYEADEAGVLEVVADEGETLPVGALIARIGEGAGADDDAGDATSGDDAGEDGEEAQAAQDDAGEDGEDEQDEAAGDDEPSADAPDEDEDEASSSGAAADDERVKASPVARRQARELGVDLASVQGTGPGGRIVKADVQAAAEAPAAQAPAPEAAPAPKAVRGDTAKGEVRTVELTRLQQVVARRMAESKATIPEFSVTTEVDMEGCVALRDQLKAAELPVVPSYNDMVVKAAALALREFPRANGSYRDGAWELYSRVNVGIAVAAQDALVVPTIFDADIKSLGAIARDARDLAAKVRNGTVSPPELSGGTFTVSNLGMYGVTEFTAVINPPQAAILTVGALAPRPVVRDGAIVPRATMALTLVSDHRILYGADAAQLLARVRALLETPAALAF